MVHIVPWGMVALRWANLLLNATASHIRLTWTISAIPDTLILFDLENYWRLMRPSSALSSSQGSHTMLECMKPELRIHLTPSCSSFCSSGINYFAEKPGFLCCPRQLCGPQGAVLPIKLPCSLQVPTRQSGAATGGPGPCSDVQFPYEDAPRMKCGHRRHRVWMDDPGALLLQAWGWPAPPGPSRQGALWRKVYTMSMTFPTAIGCFLSRWIQRN